MAEQPIRSGRYAPNNTVTLTVWNEGENPPDGYDVIRQDDGSSLAVVKERGDIKRDPSGNAYAIPEGGALAEFADGTVVTLAGSDLDDFVKSYEPVGGSDVPSTTTDSTGVAADKEAADPSTTTQTDGAEAGSSDEPNPGA